MRFLQGNRRHSAIGAEHARVSLNAVCVRQKHRTSSGCWFLTRSHFENLAETEFRQPHPPAIGELFPVSPDARFPDMRSKPFSQEAKYEANRGSPTSGLLQSARIQSVRKNDFYGIAPTTLPTGDNAYFVHVHALSTSYTVGDPLLPVAARIGVHAGTGSGAPGEATLTCGTGCTFATSSSFPFFNARGLPCTVSGQVCTQAPGVGYLTVLSTTSLTGNVSWAAVIVTGGGRIQIWSCDGAGNWVQRN